MNFSFKKSFNKKYLFLIAIFFALFFISRNASAATRTWDGEGTTNNWSEAANWSSNAVPGSGDDVIFNNTSLKNSVWDSAGPAQIITLNVQSSYSGSLTLARNVAVSGNWTYSSTSTLNTQTSTLKFVYGYNTFTPGPYSYYTIELAGTSYYGVDIVGQATTTNLIVSDIGPLGSGTLNVTGAITITAASGGGWSSTININGTGDQTLSSAGWTLPYLNINKPSGTLFLSGTIPVSNWTWQSGVIDAQTSTLKFVYGYNTFTPGPFPYYAIELAGNNSYYGLTIQGQATTTNFIVSGAEPINSGTLNITNAITITATSSGGWSSTININGTGNQTLSTAGWALPNVTINKPSGTLFLSGILPLTGNWTWQSGIIDAQTSALKFIQGYDNQNFTAGPYSYYAIELAQSSPYYGITIQGQATTTNLIVSNVGQIYSGTLNVAGAITITATSSFGGSGTINLNGTGNQTLSTAGWVLPNVNINKPSGTLYLSGVIPVFRDWIWQSGVIDAQTSTIKFVYPWGSQNFKGGSTNYYYNVETQISYSYGNYIYLISDINISHNLDIIRGTLSQASYNLRVNNAIAISQNGAWNAYSTSTSYVYVGNGGVTNNGYIDFNGGSDSYSSCTGSDSVLIRSTVGGTRRYWSGSGTFRMQDVDVKDQGGSTPVWVAQGTNSGNNGLNWSFDNNPLTYIYKANLTSSVFDSQIAGGASLNSVMFTATGIIFYGDLVKFQIASSNASSGPWSFVGPDGTNSTYYIPSYGGVNYVVPINPSQHNNKRYFRYKIFLETDVCRSISPRVKGVIINWAP